MPVGFSDVHGHVVPPPGVFASFRLKYSAHRASQAALVVKTRHPAAGAGDVRDTGSTPGWGRSPGGGHGNLLQYSCLENPMDRGDWWDTVHGVKESDTTEAT